MTAKARDDSTALRVDRPPPAPLAALVEVAAGRGAPARVRLGLEPLVVGAGPTAGLIVEDPAVSRAHVELSLAPAGVAVKDLGSRNGTFYLGQRIEKAVLTLGSRIRIGGVELVLSPDVQALASAPDLREPGYRGLVGASPAMRRLFAVLARLEGSLVSVLVEGESGVGKELVARALHAGSSVASGPMVAVNCGALGRELVMSELFGHRRGAFTGAVENRAGAFQSADGGTLFLDEIGELPLDVQPMLLRALETGEVKPVGGHEACSVKVRVIAATNRDLEAEMAAGRFREDLFYRLAVVRLGVPPLRERPEDVEFLAQRFAAEVGVGALPAQVIDELRGQRWPGNARELRNAVQAFAALGTLTADVKSGPGDDELGAALRRVVDPAVPYQEAKDAFTALFTRTYLEKLLARTGGNQSEAARVSGVERSYLGKLLVKHGVRS